MINNEHTTVPLGIRNQIVKLCDHIAYFWESEEEFAEALASWKPISEALTTALFSDIPRPISMCSPF